MLEFKFHFAAAVILSLIFSASLKTSELEEYEAEDAPVSSRNTLDDKLKAVVEGFRKKMTQPIPSMGLPTLDPFDLKVLPVNLNLNGISATGELQDLEVVGLSTFVLDRAHIAIIGLHLQFRFFLAELTVTTKLNVSVGDSLHLSGNNTLTLTGEDLTLSGDIAIGARTNDIGNLYLKNVTLDFSYGSLTVDLGEFSEDERLTAAVTSVVNDLLPQLLDRVKARLMSWADQKVTDLGNELLQNTTLSDILGSIG